MHAEAVDSGVPAAVTSVEDQGSFKIVTVSLAGNELRAKISEDQAITQGKVWLRFPTQWTKLFADERMVK